jgi:DNA-binding transcriptional LysR family regulator
MRHLDLNLWRVFDIVMELRSLTRAADRLGLTQSAVSHALRRLRLALDDPLFVRSPDGVKPTERAEQIAPEVRQALNALRGVRVEPQFDPYSATRGFTIAASSYFCALLVPPLVSLIRQNAPGIAIHVVPVRDNLVGSLDRGSVDLALGAAAEAPVRFVQEKLYDEPMVWIAAANNPVVAEQFDPSRLMGRPRVILSMTRPFEALGPSSEDILQLLPTRHVELETPPSLAGVATVYDSPTAISIVARTDHVALVPKGMAMHTKAYEDIAILGAAAGLFLEMTMLWHSQHRGDAGHHWLRDEIRHAASSAFT